MPRLPGRLGRIIIPGPPFFIIGKETSSIDSYIAIEREKFRRELLDSGINQDIVSRAVTMADGWYKGYVESELNRHLLDNATDEDDNKFRKAVFERGLKMAKRWAVEVSK